MTPGYECPVCWRAVTESRLGHTIAGHNDTAGRPCPASGASFDIAIRTTGHDKPRRR